MLAAVPTERVTFFGAACSSFFPVIIGFAIGLFPATSIGLFLATSIVPVTTTAATALNAILRAVIDEVGAVDVMFARGL